MTEWQSELIRPEPALIDSGANCHVQTFRVTPTATGEKRGMTCHSPEREVSLLGRMEGE